MSQFIPLTPVYKNFTTVNNKIYSGMWIWHYTTSTFSAETFIFSFIFMPWDQ